MNFSALHKRVVVSALMAATAIGAIAPAALAGQGPGDYKVRREVRQVGYTTYGGRTIHRSGSNVAPVIAGIIGGIAIGALLTSNSHPAYAEQDQYRYDDEPQYRYDDEDVYYVDPYEDRTYASLNIYIGSTENCSHPRFVRVMDRRSNRCLRTIRYSQNSWSDCGSGYGAYPDTYFHRSGGYGQGGYGQGGYVRGGGWLRGGYNRGGYDRGGYNRGGYDRGGYNRGGYDRGGYSRGGYDRGGYNRDGNDRGGYTRGGQGRGDDQGGYNRGGHGRGGHGRGGDGRGGDDRGGNDRGGDGRGHDRGGDQNGNDDNQGGDN